MLIDFIASIIEKELDFSPTESQRVAIGALGRFIADPESDNSFFILKGYAGTGKTSLVKAIVLALEKLRIPCRLMAPTGRAAKVLSQYTQRPASTIHRHIYRQKSLSSATGQFDLNINRDANAIFIVDEASMISGRYTDSMFGTGNVLDDIFTFSYTNKCRLIFVGDVAQLPPVFGSGSPALDEVTLSKDYLKSPFSASLTDVVRQSESSGILYNATLLRKLVNEGQKSAISLQTESFNDIVRLSGDQLVDALADSYSHVGESETVLITRSNKRANEFNRGIRQMVQWKESDIGPGDYVMIVRNNYEGYQNYTLDYVANGDVAEIIAIKNFQNLYGFRFADAVLRFPDYDDAEIEKKVIVDTLTIETPALSPEQLKEFFFKVEEDYADERNKKTRYEKIRQDQYFSALQIKFAYAVTCHKSQGGQWKHVYLDHGYLPENELDVETLRWFYTAFTRARHKLFLINFKDDFFADVQ